MGFLGQIIGTITRLIFRSSKEKVGDLVNTLDFITAYVFQFRYFKAGKPAILRAPHSGFNFPLPNRWTNSVAANSMQHPHLTAMQIEYTATDAGQQQAEIIRKNADRSLANLQVMKTLDFTKRADIASIEDVVKRYEYNSPMYKLGRETLIGESIVNGENPFLLRRFNGTGMVYDLAGSEAIENNYKKTIRQAFSSEEFNEQNLLEAGLTKQGIVEELQNGKNAYSMFFEHLEHLTGGQPLVNKPTFFMGNETINETYYLQSPYPVFMKTSNADFEGYICVAVAFRYKDERTGKPTTSVFSPFFARQPYKVWKLAQSQLLQANLNDFHIRVHLGILHFTTNQYNVPVYNCLRAANQGAFGFDKFIKHAYTMFNRGLEGVNVTATATLVSENVNYAIVNRVFNFSSANALGIIASYSNLLDMTSVTPDKLIARNGLTRQDADQNFDLLSLDLELNDILSTYIKEAYDLFGMDAYVDGLRTYVNQETPNMAIAGLNHRPLIKKSEDVLGLIQSLAYCWVGYHAHTFTTMPFAEYWDFRPSMIKKYVPKDPSEWSKIVIGEELPHPKVMMSTSQIIGGVSQKDPENYLIDIFRRKAFDASYYKVNSESLSEREEYAALEVSARKALKRLEDYGDRILEINKARLAKNKPLITWMHPSVLQSSLNI